ncbi:MAG TPA: PAAR-like domain-containing protein [Polyangiaceae bacterium]
MGFPDVCLTPAAPAPIPIPYPNMAMHAMAIPTCPTILTMMMPALNLGATIPMTMGDNAGVANPLFMQMGMFTMGSPKVILQGMPAITMACTTTGNAMNNPVGAVTVPGAPTVLYAYAASAGAVAAGACARAAVEASFVRPGVGCLAVRVFARDAPAAFHDAVRRLEAQGLVALVVDLRGNPGGEVVAAIEVARDLLPEGAPVATVCDVDGDEVTYFARGDALGLPLAVLVDGGTASSAELFAGALVGHRRARAFGTRTHGKSTVSTVSGPELVVAGSFRLPNERELGAGLEPAGETLPDSWPEAPPV